MVEKPPYLHPPIVRWVLFPVIQILGAVVASVLQVLIADRSLNPWQVAQSSVWSVGYAFGVTLSIVCFRPLGTRLLAVPLLVAFAVSSAGLVDDAVRWGTPSGTWLRRFVATPDLWGMLVLPAWALTYALGRQLESESPRASLLWTLFFLTPAVLLACAVGLALYGKFESTVFLCFGLLAVSQVVGVALTRRLSEILARRA